MIRSQQVLEIEVLEIHFDVIVEEAASECLTKLLFNIKQMLPDSFFRTMPWNNLCRIFKEKSVIFGDSKHTIVELKMKHA